MQSIHSNTLDCLDFALSCVLIKITKVNIYPNQLSKKSLLFIMILLLFILL